MAASFERAMGANETDRPSDSLLVIFPGSTESEEAVALLSDIGIYDPYMVRNRLRTRLPSVFGPCKRDEVAGPVGDRLASSGVKFMAVARDFLDAPFGGFDVVRCRFGAETIRLWDGDAKERTLFSKEGLLVVEAVYDTKKQRLRDWRGKRSRDLERFSAGLAETGFAPPSGERTGVLFLLRTGMDVVRFVAERVDFSFLGESLSLTVAENFRRLRALLEERFGPACRDMVTFGIGIETLTEENPEENAGRKGQPRQIQVRSNISSVHTMARLLCCRWQQENGWADRVFPP